MSLAALGISQLFFKSFKIFGRVRHLADWALRSILLQENLHPPAGGSLQSSKFNLKR